MHDAAGFASNRQANQLGVTTSRPATNLAEDIADRLTNLIGEANTCHNVIERLCTSFGRFPEEPSPSAVEKEPSNVLDLLTHLEYKVHTLRLTLRRLDPNV